MKCAALATLALAACADVPDSPWALPPFDPAPYLALDPASFPGAAAVLDGFAPSDDDPALRAGDAALFAVEIHRDGEIERVLLLLEVSDRCEQSDPVDGLAVKSRPHHTHRHKVTSYRLETTSPGVREWTETSEVHEVEVHPVHVALTRCDVDGQPRQRSETVLFEEAMATGLWPITVPDSTIDEDALASLLSSSLSTLAADDDVLLELLFRVVERPSLWSIVTRLGVGVHLEWMPQTKSPETVSSPAAAAPARRLPLVVLVNRALALRADLFVTKPQGATMACGGLVGAIARHPKEAGRMAVVRLLATRRGPVPSQ